MSGLERTLTLLADVAEEFPVAVLMRHAERPEPEDLPPGTELELTQCGRDESFELGRRLGTRIRRIAHSPVLRCRQTADSILLGSGTFAKLVLDDRLGGPGLFIEDSREASATFATLGVPAVLASLIAGRQLPGLARPDLASAAMIDHVTTGCEGQPPGLYLFITHDALLAPTLGWLFGREVELPDFLDALLVWRDEAAMHARHRALSTRR
jgi:hypothetical protein